MIEKIKKEIKESPNLDWLSKYDACLLLDTAKQGIEIKEGIRIIRILENLYQEVIGEDYKDVLRGVIDKYKREIRILSWDTLPPEEITLRDLMDSLKIDISNISSEKLDLKLVMGEDDGMGYTPKGFKDVIDAYPDYEKGELKIWV